MYDIVYSEKAEEDLAKLRRSEPAAFKKLLNCSTNWYITLGQVQAILNR